MAVASAPLPELPCGMHARTLSDSSRDPVPDLVTQLYCVVPKRAAVLTLGLAEFAHKSATSGGPGSPAFVLALYEPAGEAGRKVAVRSGDGGDAAGYLGAG